MSIPPLYDDDDIASDRTFKESSLGSDSDRGFRVLYSPSAVQMKPSETAFFCSYFLYGCVMKNQYQVLNNQLSEVFNIHEESGMCHRVFCGHRRGFIFHIENWCKEEVLTLVREFKCCGANCPCCADGHCAYPIQIYDKNKQCIGMLRTTKSTWVTQFGIFGPEGQQMYRIPGGGCACQGPCCTDDIVFPVFGMSDVLPVANITKLYSGIITHADTFKVTFPLDMPLNEKALIFATVFLIDMVVFQNQND